MTRLVLRSIHYGWVIVATGALVLFACFGLARYCYAMLAPSMQAGLGLSVDQMGFIGAANFTGYLVAVLLAPALLRRIRPRQAIAAGLPYLAFGATFLVYGTSIVTTMINEYGLGEEQAGRKRASRR